jgi:glycine cleavage system H protein
VNPADLLFNKTHEWTHVADEDDGKVATVGISAFALEQLTDLVYLQLPEVGQQVKAGESFGEVESVKAVSDLYSPITGEVVAVNASLPDSLEQLSEDPYGAGWIVKIRVADDQELGGLLDYASYQRQCAEEG